MRPAVGNGIERFALVCRQAVAALQELCITKNAIQRRPQFMAHVREKLTLRPGCSLGGFLGAPQFRFMLSSLRDVPQKGAKEVAAARTDRIRDRDFDWEFPSGAVKSGEFQPLIHHGCFSRAQKPLKTFSMRLAEFGWNDE